MPSNWNYVAAGYSITAVTLVGYFAWIKVRDAPTQAFVVRRS